MSHFIPPKLPRKPFLAASLYPCRKSASKFHALRQKCFLAALLIIYSYCTPMHGICQPGRQHFYKNQKKAAIPKAAWQPLQAKHTPRPCPSGWGLLRICQGFIRYSARFLSAFPDFPLRFPSVRLPWAQSPPPPQPDIYRSAACYPHTGPAADKAHGSN